MQDVICPYCQATAKLVTGKTILPKHTVLHADKMWFCEPCKAFAMCYKKENIPYGRTGNEPIGHLANISLWRLRSRANKLFQYFSEEANYTQEQAYSWLSQKLEIQSEYCILTNFDEETCKKVIELF